MKRMEKQSCWRMAAGALWRNHTGKTKNNGGFTLVELVVVLALAALLLSVSAGAMISYQTLAVSGKNNESARRMFQSAQVALSKIRTSGRAEILQTKVEQLYREEAIRGEMIRVQRQGAEGEGEVWYGLCYAGDTPVSAFLRELLEPYLTEETLLQGSFCLEMDPEHCEVRGVFYSDRHQVLSYEDGGKDVLSLGPEGSRRSDTEYRKENALGYYGVKE